VPARVQACLGGDEVGDGLGFDLRVAAADAVAGVVGDAVYVVGADVAELVGEGLDGLGGVDVLADADDTCGVVGVAVGATAGAAFERRKPSSVTRCCGS